MSTFSELYILYGANITVLGNKMLVDTGMIPAIPVCSPDSCCHL